MNETPTTPQVYAAINKVQAALAKEGIAKDRKNTQQGYAFRGIDDVYNTLCGLLAEHGLCIVPRVIGHSTERAETAKGAVLNLTTIDVEFDIVAASDGSRHVARVIGHAMDSADKAFNKAMSAAYKYLCLQVFCIPTEGDNDADGTTHEVARHMADDRRPHNPPPKPAPSVKETLAKTMKLYVREGMEAFDWNALTAWLSDGEYVEASALKGATDKTLKAMLDKLNAAIAAKHDVNAMAEAFVTPNTAF